MVRAKGIVWYGDSKNWKKIHRTITEKKFQSLVGISQLFAFEWNSSETVLVSKDLGNHFGGRWGYKDFFCIIWYQVFQSNINNLNKNLVDS